jgi:hypothetical protein
MTDADLTLWSMVAAIIFTIQPNGFRGSGRAVSYHFLDGGARLELSEE